MNPPPGPPGAPGFVRISGTAAPLLRDNIDTDAIIRSSDIDRPTRSGFGEKLFAGWRHGPDPAAGNPVFVLDDPRYRAAAILLTGNNFGCGSSREAAVWALLDHGIRAVVATGFGSIFHANCVVNGLVPVLLPAADLSELAAQAADAAVTSAPTVIEIGPVTAVVIAPNGRRFPFGLIPLHREALLSGLDAIDLTMRRQVDIEAFEARDRAARPWNHSLRRSTDRTH